MTILFRISTQEDLDACIQELREERRGWRVLDVRPDLSSNGQVLWEDLIRCLGHDVPLSTRSRAMNHAKGRAFSWLAAADLHSVVVHGANDLNPTVLNELCFILLATGVRVWLLYDVEPADDREEALLRLNARSFSLSDFLEVRTSDSTEAPPTEEAQAESPPDVPFTAFLEVAESVMSPTGFRRTRQLFESGRQDMEARLRAAESLDEDSVAHHLHEVTSNTCRAEEVVPLVKGAQAACLMAGWHLQVDVPRWLVRGRTAAVSMTLTPAQWAALGAIQRPGDAAACVLSVLGGSPDEIAALGPDAFSEDLARVSIGGLIVDVPKPARALLFAQRIQHCLVAQPDDPYVTLGVKEPAATPGWVVGVLRRATAETGVALRAQYTGRGSESTRRWTHRQGISVKELQR